MAAKWFALGALIGALGVGMGAFGAHGLKARVSADMLSVWETGARYQIIHALALLATGWAADRWPGGLANASGWLFVAGVALFSGSLYALVATGVKTWGAVTPVGGLCFIAGWLCLALTAVRGR